MDVYLDDPEECGEVIESDDMPPLAQTNQVLALPRGETFTEPISL